MNAKTEAADAIVVGGGLGGLAAATYLARGGRRVRLFEKGHDVGGRARTQTVHGRDADGKRNANEDGSRSFLLNQGAHALYRGGRGIEVLRELGVTPQGGVPGARSFALTGEALRPLPTGALDLVTTKLLSWGGRIEAAALLGRLAREAEAHRRTTESAWLGSRVKREEVRRLFAALLRVSTYANDPARQSAGAALAQLARAIDGNVLYVDGGWQTLANGLRAAAEAAGVSIETNARVKTVEHDGAARGVRLLNGDFAEAATVVIAAGPSSASALLGDASASLRAFAARAQPVHAACLDLALDRLPNPDVLFVSGFDAPLYLSVHSASARLAPPGGAIVHVAKYLPPNAHLVANPHANEHADHERELEALVDRAQPGFRDVVVERRYMPKLIVTHALVTAEGNGEAGRPSCAVPEIPGVYVVGDWVSDEGMLADATLASARRAAHLALRDAAPRANVRAPRTSPTHEPLSRELR